MSFPLWVVGVGVSAMASFSGTMGLTLQKITHQNIEKARLKLNGKDALESEVAMQALGGSKPNGGADGAVHEDDEQSQAESSVADSDHHDDDQMYEQVRAGGAVYLPGSRASKQAVVPKRKRTGTDPLRETRDRKISHGKLGVRRNEKKDSTAPSNGRAESALLQGSDSEPHSEAKAKAEAARAAESGTAGRAGAEASPSAAAGAASSADGDGKPSSKEEESKEIDSRYWKSPTWLLGMFFVILGAFLDTISFGLAPQSLLAPMASLTLVFNTVVAPRVLGESLSRHDILATFVIIGGTAMVVTGGARETPEYTVPILRDLYLRPQVLVYGCSVVGIILSFGSVAGRFSFRDAPAPVGIAKALYRLSFPVMAGVIGGQSVLFSKCTIELLKSTVTSDNQFVYPETYGFIAALAFTLFLQVKWLNAALARFDALFVIPVYQVVWMLAGIVGGFVLFDEYEEFGTLQWALFPTGAVVIFLGIYLLTQRDMKHEVLGKSNITDEGFKDILVSSVAHRASVFDPTMFSPRTSTLLFNPEHVRRTSIMTVHRKSLLMNQRAAAHARRGGGMGWVKSTVGGIGRAWSRDARKKGGSVMVPASSQRMGANPAPGLAAAVEAAGDVGAAAAPTSSTDSVADLAWNQKQLSVLIEGPSERGSVSSLRGETAGLVAPPSSSAASPASSSTFSEARSSIPLPPNPRQHSATVDIGYRDSRDTSTDVAHRTAMAAAATSAARLEVASDRGRGSGHLRSASQPVDSLADAGIVDDNEEDEDDHHEVESIDSDRDE